MTVPSLAQFYVDVSKAAELPAAEASKLQKKIAKSLLTKIVERTPVLTGRTRKSWITSLGAPSYEDREISDPIADGKTTIDKAKLEDLIWIANSRPQINVLEYGGFVPADPGPSRRDGQVHVKGGFSTQAPQGMVGISVLEVEQEIR